MMRQDWVKPYHDKATEAWINHVYPVNKGNMKRVDNQREWPRGLKVRSKGMVQLSVYELRLVKPIGPQNIATKIKTALPPRSRLQEKTTRGLLTWGHFKFRQRLQQKAELVRGCTVVICDEPYTSKTCGACGNIHKKLSGIKCPNPSCSYVADRDANGAHNIFARYMMVNGIEV